PGPVAAALPGVTLPGLTLPGLTLPGLTLPGLARGSGDLVSPTQAMLTDLVGRDVDVVAAHPVAGGPDEGPAIPDVEDPRHRDQRAVVSRCRRGCRRRLVVGGRCRLVGWRRRLVVGGRCRLVGWRRRLVVARCRLLFCSPYPAVVGDCGHKIIP